MSTVALLEQGRSAGFHIANEIRDAGSAEARARILLCVPDDLLLSMTGALSRACFDTDFALGQNFIDARVAAMCAVRLPNGLLPEASLALLERYRRLMTQLAGVE